MEYIKKLTILSMSIFVMSCAGIGIPDSSDPNKKLDYAYLAMNKGRSLPAEHLIKGAIEIFTRNNDEEGLAEAYSVYGHYYKYEGWIQGKSIISAEKSVESFNLAISKFEKIGKNMGIAKSYFGLANAYGSLNNNSKQCESYDQSLVYYREGIQNEKPFKVNSRFVDFPQMVDSFKASYCRS